MYIYTIYYLLLLLSTIIRIYYYYYLLYSIIIVIIIIIYIHIHSLNFYMNQRPQTDDRRPVPTIRIPCALAARRSLW